MWLVPPDPSFRIPLRIQMIAYRGLSYANSADIPKTQNIATHNAFEAEGYVPGTEIFCHEICSVGVGANFHDREFAIENIHLDPTVLNLDV